MTGRPRSDAQDLAAELEQRLGDPYDAGSPFSYARLTELDSAAELPSAACRELDELGMARYLVPAGFGGALASYEDILQLWRAVARRDLTVAITHANTYLGAACVWIAGEPAQAATLARDILAGCIVSCGLTEPGHGADLLACELSATPVEEGWRVAGQKWPINSATRAPVVCVLARTDPAGGPRGFSLLLADKRQLPAGSYRCLAKAPTHGIRGADISGIAFDSTPLGVGAVVGPVGGGLEIILKVLQITRTGCAAFSMGAADHALRLAVDIMAEHPVGERRLLDLPYVRRAVTQAAASLLVAEAVSLVAARSINALPAEMSVISAVTKALVPSIVDEMILRLADLLPGWAILGGLDATRMFRKIERDHRIVGIFDGSVPVVRSALINQFPVLSRAYRRMDYDAEGLAEAAAVSGPVRDFAPHRLSLVAKHGCSLVQSFSDAATRMRDLAGSDAVAAELAQPCADLLAAVRTTHQELAAQHQAGPNMPASSHVLAQRYELCFAAAACLQLWLRNRRSAGHDEPLPLWRDGTWLHACLGYLLGRLRPDVAYPERSSDGLLDIVTRSTGRGAFSILPTPMTGGWS